MGTWYAVRYVREAAAPSADELAPKVEAELAAINAEFSTYLPDSTISRFNRAQSTEPFEVGEEFTSLLRTALVIAEQSGGAYDPTIQPLVRLFGFGPVREVPDPTTGQIAAVRAHIGWRLVEIVDGTRIRKLDPALELDLSSIAKGAGVDRLSSLLGRLGCAAHMVEIGGEVVCRGRKPDGGGWRIGIEAPPAESGAEPGAPGRAVRRVVELVHRAMATSGSYRNYHESGGTRMHHVIDARTGTNAQHGVVSVSVEAADCALADGLATALMLLGPDAAEPLLDAWASASPRALFLIADGQGGVREVGLRWDER